MLRVLFLEGTAYTVAVHRLRLKTGTAQCQVFWWCEVHHETWHISDGVVRSWYCDWVTSVHCAVMFVLSLLRRPSLSHRIYIVYTYIVFKFENSSTMRFFYFKNEILEFHLLNFSNEILFWTDFLSMDPLRAPWRFFAPGSKGGSFEAELPRSFDVLGLRWGWLLWLTGYQWTSQ